MGRSAPGTQVTRLENDLINISFVINGHAEDVVDDCA
jgi:hypothetical protein